MQGHQNGVSPGYDRDHTGTRLSWNEDTRWASLEALLAEDLTGNIQMNRSRFVDYASLRSEIVFCGEARVTSVIPLLSSKNDRTDDPMSTSSFDKGKGEGKKSSPGTGEATAAHT